jgi:hypothetical protein
LDWIVSISGILISRLHHLLEHQTIAYCPT